LPALFRQAAAPADPDELAWYDAALPRSGTVLDLACGTGRLLLPLAAAGRALHGIERTHGALALCEARLRDAGLQPTLMRQSMSALNAPFRYTAAYAARGTFQSLADAKAAREALRRVRAHLVPPGVLLLEVFVPSPTTLRLAAPLVEVRTARLPDGTHIALRSETTTDADARMARSRNRYVHRRGTRRLGEETESATLTWYSRDDIASLLRAEGFGSIEFADAPAEGEQADAYRVRARLP
jgi:SAM-dependent methyltransferase